MPLELKEMWAFRVLLVRKDPQEPKAPKVQVLVCFCIKLTLPLNPTPILVMDALCGTTAPKSIPAISTFLTQPTIILT